MSRRCEELPVGSGLGTMTVPCLGSNSDRPINPAVLLRGGLAFSVSQSSCPPCVLIKTKSFASPFAPHLVY